MKRRALGTALLCAALAARAAPAAGAPPCLASAHSVPAEAFVGQQVVWRLEILRREQVSAVEWSEPPAFPSFRVAWLPGQPELGGVTRDGVEYVGRVEERALFPERSGELVIAPKPLRCLATGGEVFLAPVAPTRLRVKELPAAGRPPEFDGLVGALGLEVALHPRRLALGTSARLELTLRGEGNLWDVRDPLPRLAGLEIFARVPALDLEPGTQLLARRRFVYDLVPEQAGRYELGAVRVAWFDPVQQRYTEATAPPLVLEVEPAAARAPLPAPVPGSRVGVRVGASPATRVLLVLLALLAGGALLWLRLRNRRADVSSLAGLAEAAPDPVQDAAALSRALRTALEPWVPGARSAAVEELRAPLTAGVAVALALALLVKLERSRFDPGAPAPSRADVLAALALLARR